MKTKRAISILLALASLLAASCGSTTSDTATDSTGSETTPAPETTRDYPEITPEMNYNGYEFRINGYEGGYGTHNDYVIEDGEDTSDIISDAIYRRNSKVEELLGIKITAQWGQEIRNTVLNSVTAGDDEFDLVFVPGFELAASLGDKTYVNLLDQKNVDWTKPWFNQSFIDAIAINGKLNFIDSAISTQFANATAAVFCNKKLATDYDFGDMYGMVRDGTWTVDKLYDFSQSAVKDLNGDGEIHDDADQLGILGNSGLTYMLFKGMGGNFIVPDGNGLKDIFGEEGNVDKMTYILTRFPKSDVFESGTNDAAKAAFIDGRALFYNTALGSFNWFRDVSFEFGVLPMPKLDEKQSDYRCNVNYWANSFMGIPKTVSDLQKVSDITNVLAAESYYVLRNAYVDNAIKHKYAPTEDDTEMVNIILDSCVYDIAIIYQIGGLAKQFENMFYEGKDNVVSSYESIKKSVSAAIDEFVNSVD